MNLSQHGHQIYLINNKGINILIFQMTLDDFFLILFFSKLEFFKVDFEDFEQSKGGGVEPFRNLPLPIRPAAGIFFFFFNLIGLITEKKYIFQII